MATCLTNMAARNNRSDETQHLIGFIVGFTRKVKKPFGHHVHLKAIFMSRFHRNLKFLVHHSLSVFNENFEKTAKNECILVLTIASGAPSLCSNY